MYGNVAIGGFGFFCLGDCRHIEFSKNASEAHLLPYKISYKSVTRTRDSSVVLGFPPAESRIMPENTPKIRLRPRDRKSVV